GAGEIPPDAGTPKAGSFKGSAQLGVIPQGDLTAQLALEAVPVQRALALIPKAAEQAGGAFSGHVDLRVPAGRLKDPTAWEASGDITAKRLQLYGMTLEDAAVAVKLHGGVASVQAAHGHLADSPVSASAELRLTDSYPFTGKLSLAKADLAALQQLASELRPPLFVTGNLDTAAEVTGTLSPFVFQASGSGTASDLVVEQLKIGSLRLRWQGDAERISVTDIQADLYSGKLNGNAVLPLRISVAGNVDVRVDDLDVGTLSRDVPRLPIHLDGRASGRLEGTLSPAPQGRAREFSSKLELQAVQLRVQGIPTERLHGSIDYRNQALSYRLEGETLGGRFD